MNMQPGSYINRLKEPLSSFLQNAFQIPDYRELTPTLMFLYNPYGITWRLEILDSYKRDFQFTKEFVDDQTEDEMWIQFTEFVGEELLRRRITKLVFLEISKAREEDEDKNKTILQRPPRQDDSGNPYFKAE